MKTIKHFWEAMVLTLAALSALTMAQIPLPNGAPSTLTVGDSVVRYPLDPRTPIYFIVGGSLLRRDAQGLLYPVDWGTGQAIGCAMGHLLCQGTWYYALIKDTGMMFHALPYDASYTLLQKARPRPFAQESSLSRTCLLGVR